jgi:hypothetical protein
MEIFAAYIKTPFEWVMVKHGLDVYTFYGRVIEKYLF